MSKLNDIMVLSNSIINIRDKFNTIYSNIESLPNDITLLVNMRDELVLQQKVINVINNTINNLDMKIKEKQRTINDISTNQFLFLLKTKNTDNSMPKLGEQYHANLTSINSIYNLNIPKFINYKLPTVSNINHIPQSLYWFNGSRKKPAGPYIRIRDSIIQLPVINVINDKYKLLECKNKYIKNCTSSCSFTHYGENFNKMAIRSRCSIPTFGNTTSLHEDIKKISMIDIKKMLAQALSDILLVDIWLCMTQEQKQLPYPYVLINIDKFT